MTSKTATDRLRYSRQFGYILDSGNASELLQLQPNKRIHVMKALSCLAQYTGKQDIWLDIRKRYNLRWTTGTEKLDAFTRFFDYSTTLDDMIGWLRETLKRLPDRYANVFLFCALTGMRASESLESINLIKDPNSFKRYYDPNQRVLRHYLYADTFIRRTKAVYVSTVNDEILQLAKSIDKT